MSEHRFEIDQLEERIAPSSFNPGWFANADSGNVGQSAANPAQAPAGGGDQFHVVHLWPVDPAYPNE
jgi:hypothetical protein